MCGYYIYWHHEQTHHNITIYRKQYCPNINSKARYVPYKNTVTTSGIFIWNRVVHHLLVIWCLPVSDMHDTGTEYELYIIFVDN